MATATATAMAIVKAMARYGVNPVGQSVQYAPLLAASLATFRKGNEGKGSRDYIDYETTHIAMAIAMALALAMVRPS